MKAKKTNTKMSNFIASLSELGTEAAMQTTVNDFKNSLILVSIAINITVLTTWMVIQLSY